MNETARQQYGYDGYWTLLRCGHWLFTKYGNIIDGCPRCTKLEMRDEKDRRPPRK